MKSRSDLRFGIAGLLLLASIVATPPVLAQEAQATEDPALDALRDRFRAGLEKYRAGAFAEAILIWENVYRELGPERGYRLTFDLARAYEQFGDLARAAESYELYLDGIAQRRSAGDAIETAVEKQEGLARARLEELSTTQGRIRIAAEGPLLVKIDNAAERRVPATGLTAYVVPDKIHVVTFDPGTKDERHIEVTVGRGELTLVHPPPIATRDETKTEPIAPPPVLASLPPARVRPFDGRILYAGAGLTVLSAALPIAFYLHAKSVQDDYDAAISRAQTTGDSGIRQAAIASATQLRANYDTARQTEEISLAVPLVIGVATVGLAAYWLLGTKAQRVQFGAMPLHRGVGAASLIVF